MPDETPDPALPSGSRLLGYVLADPSDGNDYPTLLITHCNHRAWTLEGTVFGTGLNGDHDDEWPRIVRTAVRLGASGLLVPSADHLAPTHTSHFARVSALTAAGIVIRTVPSVAVMVR